MEYMNQHPIKCPKCGGNMICESWSLDPNIHEIREGQSVDPYTYRLRCPAGHIWDLVEVKGEPRRVIDTCVFCGKAFYDGDDWTNYLPKEIIIKRGQDAADAYRQGKCKAICPDCEKDHPTSRQHHDGIMWARLMEDYKDDRKEEEETGE